MSDRHRRHARMILLATVVAAAPLAAVTQAAQADATALRLFQERMRAYLDLRATMAREQESLTLTGDAVELALRQQALGAALAAARTGAKPGDLIPTPVAALIRAVVLDDFQRRTAAAERAVFSEVAATPRPAINETYPASAALPTIPPLLLSRLPRLPDNLQYRFYGNDVVLLDGDVQLILDVVTDVLPSR